MSLIIGLDIGTSSVKAALFESDGRVLASASTPVPMYIPQPGWAEQEPEDWWHAARQVLKQIAQRVNGSEIAAIGLSGQCPGHVLVDRQRQSIGRAIIWRDQRAQEEARWLSEAVSSEQAQESLGTSFIGDPTGPLARLLWLKRYRQGDWDAAIRVLQPKDYIALRLTGELMTDRFSAYCLAHAQTGKYDRKFFEQLEIDSDKLPQVFMPADIIGQLTLDGETETGVKAGTKVIAGTIDAYCDTLAGGIACKGRAVDVAGTSEIVSLRIEQPVQAEGIFPGRLDEDVEFLCGPTQAGGETLRWLARNFYPESGGNTDFCLMETEAESATAGSDGLIFLPYLDGERTPLWDADARGTFFGLTFAHQRRHFTRAAYEGIAFAIRHILELSEQANGTPAEKIVACGGGSRSRFWNQVKADVLQRPIYPAEIGETGCLGAAIIAAVGAQMYANLDLASQAMVRLKAAIQPNPAVLAVYEESYQVYRQLYPVLKPLTTRKVKPTNLEVNNHVDS